MAVDNNITENSDYSYELWLSRYYGKGIIYSQARCFKEIKKLLSKGLLPEKPELRCDLGRCLYLEMGADSTEIEWLAINLIDLASSDGFTEATELLEKILNKYREQAKNGDLMSQSVLERFSALKAPHKAEARRRLDSIRPATKTYSKSDTDLLYKLYESINELRQDNFKNTGKIIAHTDRQHEQTRAVVMTEGEKIRQSVDAVPEEVKERIASELDKVTEKFSPGFSEIEKMHKQMQGDISDIKQGVGEMKSDMERLSSKMQEFFDKMDEECKAQANAPRCRDLRETCEQELSLHFGDYWTNGQLLESTKESLIAAEVLLAFAEKQNLKDCRGIVISATSALELELKARFYTGIRKYFAEAGVWDGKTEVALPDNLRGKLNNEDKFTIGNVYYILNCEDYRTGQPLNGYSEQKIKCLREYLSNKLISDDVVSNKYRYGERDYCVERPEDVFIFNGRPSFTEKLYNIVNDYRNPAAHTGVTSEETAKRCWNDVVGRALTEISNIKGLIFDLLLLTDKFNHNTNLP